MRKYLGFTDPVIPTSYAAELVKLVEGRNPGRNVLEGAGITAPMLSSPKARVSFEQLTRLICNALHITGDPGLGLDYGRHIHVGGLGMLGYAAMSARDLAGAVSIAVRYHRILVPHVELHLELEGERASLVVEEQIPLGALKPFVIESLLTCLASMGSFVTGKSLSGLTARLDYPAPPHADRYRDIFGGGVTFDAAKAALGFDRAALETPVVYASDATARMAEEQCAIQLSPLLGYDGVVRRVRNLLHTRDGSFPDVRELARTLQTSERSLRRALSEHGTSYQTLLDEARRNLALEYLSSTRVPVEDIARSVGFGSSRSFRRAFKRWTGKSPSELRESA